MLDMKFNEQKSDSDVKFNEINSNFNDKFNELKKQNNELKNDINEINKRCENTNEIFENNFKKLEQNIERMVVWGINTGKNNTNESDGNICINGSGSSLDTKQVTVDQVSNNDNYNDGLTSDNSGEIKNVVLAVSYTHLDVYKRQAFAKGSTNNSNDAGGS